MLDANTGTLRQQTFMPFCIRQMGPFGRYFLGLDRAYPSTRESKTLILEGRLPVGQEFIVMVGKPGFAWTQQPVTSADGRTAKVTFGFEFNSEMYMDVLALFPDQRIASVLPNSVIAPKSANQAIPTAVPQSR
jgi:hypothetical protein